MDYIPITITIAALLAVLAFVLSLTVSMGRINLGKSEGDVGKYPIDHGDHEPLKRRIAAFNNFSQYTPLALIMLALVEFDGASATLVWSLGIAFFVGRILHIYGMLQNPHFPPPRIIGMFATYAVLLVPAGWMLFAA